MQLRLTLASCLVLFTCLLNAQLNRGGLTGTIYDSTGAGVPSANVTAQNSETGSLSQTVSGSSGEYAFPNLSPGTYSITVEAAGFKRTTQAKVGVSVAATQRIDITLDVG